MRSTSPTLPSRLHLDEAKNAERIEHDLKLMRDQGWEAEHLPIWADDSMRQTVLNKLTGTSFGCIVIGASVRITTKHVPEFEIVVNAVIEGAPRTPIAFNSSLDSSGDTAAR